MCQAIKSRKQPYILNRGERYMPHKTNHKKKVISLERTYANDFALVIRERGKEYFLNKKIKTCIKNNNEYYATVTGSEHNEYHVFISTSKSTYQHHESINYVCDCPFEFPCKHIYAVLLAIDNKQYIKPKLKPELPQKNFSFKKFIQMIPPKQLKKYLLQHLDDHKVVVDKETMKQYFIEYVPKEPYEFYYNHLYNAYILQQNVEQELQYDMMQLREYMNHSDFQQAFLILKAIICSMIDTNHLSNEESVIDLLLKLRMYLRIIMRKADEQLKENFIVPWIKQIEDKNFYNHIYLEDVFSDIIPVAYKSEK